VSSKVHISGQPRQLFEPLKNNGLFCCPANPFLDAWFWLTDRYAHHSISECIYNHLLFIDIDAFREKTHVLRTYPGLAGRKYNPLFSKDFKYDCPVQKGELCWTLPQQGKITRIPNILLLGEHCLQGQKQQATQPSPMRSLRQSVYMIRRKLHQPNRNAKVSSHFRQTYRYCWRTQKCRYLWSPHAFFEGKKAWETCARKSTSRTLNEIRQQYPYIIGNVPGGVWLVA
jgi:hypothetical protein